MRHHTHLARAFTVLGVAIGLAVSSPAQTPQTNSSEQRPGSTSSSGQREGSTSSSEQRSTSTADGKMVGQQDERFMHEAAEGGLMEVRLAQMAKEKASDPKVKEYAERIIKDHSTANEKLMTVASERQVQLPKEMGQKHEKQVSKLENLSGSDFDRAYVKAMVSDHKKDVRAFKRQSERAMDSDVKAFATETLPTLEQHLQMAQQLSTDLKNSGTRSRSAEPMHKEGHDATGQSPRPAGIPTDRDRQNSPDGRTSPDGRINPDSRTNPDGRISPTPQP